MEYFCFQRLTRKLNFGSEREITEPQHYVIFSCSLVRWSQQLHEQKKMKKWPSSCSSLSRRLSLSTSDDSADLGQVHKQGNSLLPPSFYWIFSGQLSHTDTWRHPGLKAKIPFHFFPSISQCKHEKTRRRIREHQSTSLLFFTLAYAVLAVVQLFLIWLNLLDIKNSLLKSNFFKQILRGCRKFTDSE